MSIFTEFGLRQIINASGKMTALGASAVSNPVAAALQSASQDYVDISELYIKAGEVIAPYTGAEDALPTTGAAAGIAIATAAVITGTNLNLIETVPNVKNVSTEIIVQKGHSVNFGAPVAQMISIGGGKVVEVGQSNQVEIDHIKQAINENTAGLFYIKSHHAVQKGMLPLENMMAVGREYGLPVIVDAAAEEDLKKYIQLGADLVIYSGGKAIEGPTSGFICGKKQLIKACRMQYKGVGRPMKIGKEGIMGLLAAIQHYHEKESDADSQLSRMEALCKRVNEEVNGMTASIVQDEAGRAIYRAKLTIDEKQTGYSAYQLIHELESGNPAIYTRNHYANLNIINIDPRPLLEGQEVIIVNRLKEILGGNQK
ncbi:DgaE family pyridoxal phosphate-dependent ammonia lyase [Pullulanibacillus sp. KACC 23026]|uniref:DgaE family pyridoxal phosphate-dependent ammonia lyase n=1 Tax=Pullulanibacillus sp. KACC 23026 TaxID=3028315 RepID=UPI0023AF80E3|nr:DgaE family pyridoxal phosphate-dependent ammonia lyase [Pullulanibacillus sp. KACC 23026]WEG11212.1 DgaE family pyridoxal phosphate-dependent ammonia lyase [Pullulanibacillus sp. KACC 23026]